MIDVGAYLQGMDAKIRESNEQLQQQRQQFEQQMIQATSANQATQQQLEQTVGALNTMGNQLQEALKKTAEVEQERAGEDERSDTGA